MTHTPSLRLLLDLADLGRVMSSAMAQAVGDQVTENVSVLILCTLELEGPKRPTELMDVTGLSSGGMTKAIDRLAINELVERGPDPTDGRAFLVVLTPKGSAAVGRMLEAFETVLETEGGRLRRPVEFLRRM